MTKVCDRCTVEFEGQTNGRFCATCRPIAYRENKVAYQRERRARGIGTGRAYRNRTLYGLSESAYQAMLDANAGQCPICLVHTEDFHVDHDHSSGAIRGLICKHCNWALGHADDNPWILDRLAAYMRAHYASVWAGRGADAG